MTAPDGLGQAGQRAWERAVVTLDAVGADAGLYEVQLERLALLNDDLALARKRWVAKRRPMTELGARNSQVPHSLLRTQEMLAYQIRVLETELGLTWMAQRKGNQAGRAGRPSGAASAADRRPSVRTLRRAS